VNSQTFADIPRAIALESPFFMGIRLRFFVFAAISKGYALSRRVVANMRLVPTTSSSEAG
jgi:hypothetical protein